MGDVRYVIGVGRSVPGPCPPSARDRLAEELGISPDDLVVVTPAPGLAIAAKDGRLYRLPVLPSDAAEPPAIDEVRGPQTHQWQAPTPGEYVEMFSTFGSLSSSGQQ